MSKEYTYAQVAEHKTKKDFLIVIDDKVYNPVSFIDEHPGGEEVLLDVAGADATEAFEDVGHSDEAREILEKLFVGKLKRGPNDPKPASMGATDTSSSTRGKHDGAGLGVGLYALIAMGALLAYAGYYVMQSPDSKK